MYFVAKVTKHDDDGELDWPAEMVETTTTTPALLYSCNPLVFDFGMLTGKPKPKSVTSAEKTTSKKTSEKKKKHKKHRHKSRTKVRGKVHICDYGGFPVAVIIQ